MSTETTERALIDPPKGPGRLRPTQHIKSGWQIWDSGAGEWLTVDIIAEFNTGRVRYVCEEREPDTGEYVTFDTMAGGHTIWSRSTVEQKEAARLRWDQTVDGRWLTWVNGKGWALVSHRRDDLAGEKPGWYLHATLGGHMVVTPGPFAGKRLDVAKKNAVDLIRSASATRVSAGSDQTGGTTNG